MTEFDRQKKSNAPIMQAYHGVDVLIIDDIQNIIGKRASVDYFFQLMDEFIRNNKKVVIAADRAPKDLSMDERLTSRFNAGMLCLVAEPSYEMKYKILQRYYENTIAAAPEAGDDSLLAAYGGDGGHLTDEHFKHMAEVSGTNHPRTRELLRTLRRRGRRPRTRGQRAQFRRHRRHRKPVLRYVGQKDQRADGPVCH